MLLNYKKWLCKSTGKKDKDDAIAMAHRIFIDHEIRLETNTLVQSKRFRYVAQCVILTLEKELAAKVGTGSEKERISKLEQYIDSNTGQDFRKLIQHDYSRALNNYHIPYFDRIFITSIDQESIRKFDQWRIEKFGKTPASSTLLTHNSALQLVLKKQ